MVKMAAKSKKRLSAKENKLLKLNKIDLKDVICSICQSILIEPVTLPCYHDFCKRCFNGSIENNSLCCPLCRLRIGSWLRTATKQKSLVNTEFWEYIKTKFPNEIDIKLKGDDVILPQEKTVPRLSAPGEIRSEYEAELRRLKEERLKLEEKHLQETQLLIKKIQQDEQEAQNRYLEILKHDEILAQQMQQSQNKNAEGPTTPQNDQKQKRSTLKPRLKAVTIDGFLCKPQAASVTVSPLLTDDNSSTDTLIEPSTKPDFRASPEMVPGYGKLLKNIIEKKIKGNTSLWNKENGKNDKQKEEPQPCYNIDEPENKNKETSKSVVKSLVVSLPLPSTGILQYKKNVTDNRNLETGSADSMRQELCYFKPIEKTTPSNIKMTKNLPLRVPCQRVGCNTSSPQYESPPSRIQYLEGLTRLRNLSLAKNLPSAFVIALNILRVKKENPINKCEPNTRPKTKRAALPSEEPTLPPKRYAPNRIKPITQVEGITKLNMTTSLRRTRSMGSITKDENETTPKKAKIKDRKSVSERKPYLRSDSKKLNAQKILDETPPSLTKIIDNDKVNLAVKNLSSPLKNCDVKKILQEQLRIEKIIEQEKSDFDLAQKMDAEWNGRRQLRRPVKRQVTLNYAVKPAKKLKV